MSAKTPRQIAFEDIRKGDEIEGRWDHAGVSMTVRGVVHTLREGAWIAEGGGLVASSYWPRWRYYLLHRPVPAEPKGVGAVVRAAVRVWSADPHTVRTLVRTASPYLPWIDEEVSGWVWSDLDPESIEVLSEGIEVDQ